MNYLGNVSGNKRKWDAGAQMITDIMTLDLTDDEAAKLSSRASRSAACW